MNTRIIIIIVAAVIFTIVGFGAAWSLIPDQPQETVVDTVDNVLPVEDTTPTDTTTTGVVQDTTTTQPTTVVPEKAAGEDRSEPLRLARLFVERYGSYSNNSNFQNVVNVMVFTTPELRAEFDAYIKTQNVDTSQSYSITTRALSPSIVDFTENESAIVRVVANRTEKKGVEPANTFSQTAVLYMEFYEGAWKVANIVWE